MTNQYPQTSAAKLSLDVAHNSC